MSLAGMGVVAIWHDLLPEAKEEFYEWHSREHLPERVTGWVVLIEGHSVADVRGACEELTPGLQAHNASAFDSAIYRHEFARLKTPWSAG